MHVVKKKTLQDFWQHHPEAELPLRAWLKDAERAEWRTLHDAARLRGFAPRTSMHCYRTIGYLLGMTFVRGLDRAARVSEAMLLRGFSGRFTSLAVFRASRVDAAFAAGFAVALGVIICGDIYLGAFGG